MAILFFIALILAWPTSGLSLVAYLAFFVISSIFKAKSRMHNANQMGAMRDLLAGTLIMPSWSSNAERRDEFVYSIQRAAAHKGVQESYLQETLMNPEALTSLVHYAGAMEQRGASFIEQQAAVAEMLVELWRRLGQEEQQRYLNINK